jgi:hypothetical protein
MGRWRPVCWLKRLLNNLTRANHPEWSDSFLLHSAQDDSFSLSDLVNGTKKTGLCEGLGCLFSCNAKFASGIDEVLSFDWIPPAPVGAAKARDVEWGDGAMDGIDQRGFLFLRLQLESVLAA